MQYLPVLDRQFGSDVRAALLEKAGVMAIPDDSSMIPEGDAIRLHQGLRRAAPEQAPVLARDAGQGTADYILAHRIPPMAQNVLRKAPAFVSAPVLARAIARHAWTFAGSGQFRCLSPWRFEIADNPLVRGERSDTCLCYWHAAVFERLYQSIVGPSCRCRELSCCAQGRGARCVFELHRSA